MGLQQKIIRTNNKTNNSEHFWRRTHFIKQQKLPSFERSPTVKNTFKVLAYLLIIKIFPSTRFKNPKEAILTLKMITVQEAAVIQ
jgi:hypothetical protein